MQSRIFRLATILQELASEKRRLAEQSSELQRKLEEMSAQQLRLEELESQLRKAVAVAATTTDATQADEFESSRYGSINLMWTIQPYLTLGVEYAYGQNERADGTSLRNNRVALGIQIY